MSGPGQPPGWGPPGGQTPPGWGQAPQQQQTPPPGWGGTPPPGGGTPGGGAPGGWTPQGAAPPAAAPTGTWIGVVISVLFLLLSMVSCAATGIVAATESERFAVEVAHVTVPTILAGLFPWIIALLLRKKSTGIAVAAPIGCGCFTWFASLVSMFVFFEFVWPEL